MEVKIGVTESARELVVSSNQAAEEVESLVADSLKDTKGTLTLTDDKGRKIIVPSARISYVEITPTEQRKMGFSVGS